MKTPLVLFVLLVISVAVAGQRSAEPQLLVRLRSDKDTYSLRGNINLEIIRENMGAEQLIVCRQWAWGFARTEVHVFDAIGKEVHTDFMPDELPPPPQPYDFVLLSGGDFIGTRLSEPARHFVSSPGDYDFVVKYTSYLSESYVREMMKMPSDRFWSRERGATLSNGIKLHINE